MIIFYKTFTEDIKDLTSKCPFMKLVRRKMLQRLKESHATKIGELCHRIYRGLEAQMYTGDLSLSLPSLCGSFLIFFLFLFLCYWGREVLIISVIEGDKSG